MGTFTADFSNIENPLSYGRFLLYQTGRRILPPEEEVSEHTHRDYFELTMVRSGEGIVTTNAKQVRIFPGDIYVSFGGDFHAIATDGKKPLIYDYLAFSVGEERFLHDSEWLVGTFGDAGLRIIREDKIDRLMPWILEERREEDIYHEQLMETLLCEVFCLVLRAFHKKQETHTEKEVSDEVVLCYEMMNYIDTHIYHIRTLAEVAEAMNYNYNYLSNLFKAVTDETLLGYYRRKRFELARQLLEDRTNTVTRVAAMLNYSSVYTFSRAYKEYFGISPSKYSGGEE